MVDAIIERVQTSNTKSARAHVVLSFAMQGQADLFLRLAEQTGNPMRVSFEAIAQQLGFGDDPNEGIEPEGAHMWASTTGDVMAAHALEPSSESVFTCSLCGHGKTHPVHSQAEILMRQAREETRTAAVEPDVTLNSETTEEQEAARERLATTSRRGRGNGAAAE